MSVNVMNNALRLVSFREGDKSMAAVRLVMPDGTEVPGVTKITVHPIQPGCIVTATVEMAIGFGEATGE